MMSYVTVMFQNIDDLVDKSALNLIDLEMKQKSSTRLKTTAPTAFYVTVIVILVLVAELTILRLFPTQRVENAYNFDVRTQHSRTETKLI